MGQVSRLVSDGVEIAVESDGPPEAPVVVLVHGYPDNRRVWDGVVERLVDDFRVVRYDVRGCGDSGAPAGREGYRIDQLNRDLAAVMDAVSPDRPVHLVGHDWGSVQAWGAVSGNIEPRRIASFTSISGPSLDHAGVWLRGLRGHGIGGAATRLRQLAESAYVVAFQAPRLPELAWRSGVLDRLIALGSRAEPNRQERDKINGLELYRANLIGRLRRPEPSRVSVPVQVIAPSRDPYVSVPLATQAPAPYTDDLRIDEVRGGHWVIADRPEVIADLIRDFIEALPVGAGR
ncbi:MAG: alpha/beta fold hydrolase [Nocardioides sp.]|uniref:alpha/beta fold hydrolase n=1 Tax=Nocardioides sp. TaxID=35761 RepID=UPI0039E222BA